MSTVAGRVVIPAMSVAITAQLLRALLARWSHSRYGGLESLVSFSSRLIAAARAAESKRTDAFVIDPLAYILAGPKAMAKYQDDDQTKTTSSNDCSSTRGLRGPQQADQQEQTTQQISKGVAIDTPVTAKTDPSMVAVTTADTCTVSPPTPASSSSSAAQASAHAGLQEQQQQQRPVPRLIMRTVFFDDVVLAAVGKPAQRSLSALKAFLQQKQQRGLPHCTQVVLLGSGMDTRPWRLDLPPGVAWFEVDRHDVLRAKQKELQQSGVKFSPSDSSSSIHSTGREQRSWGRVVGLGNYLRPKAQKKREENAEHWLKAETWSCAAVDLQEAGWSDQLRKIGLDTTKPTLWVAEGLLYYLEPNCVKGMLQEIAQISAPGSMFASNFITESGLKSIREGSSRRSTAATTDKSQASGADLTATGQGSGSEQGDTHQASARRGGASSLLSQFIWGCPDNVDQYFNEHSWEMLVCLPWTDAAEAYSWKPQQAASAAGRSKSQQLQLTIAVRSQ